MQLRSSKIKIITSSLIVILTILSLTACSSKTLNRDKKGANQEEGGKIHVVTTIFPIYDFVRAIVGDHANLTLLVKPGTSIHSYDPSPADIKELSEADAFIYIGGESEAWVNRILSSSDVDQSNIHMLGLFEQVDRVEEEVALGMETEEGEGSAGNRKGTEYDEHIWTSPRNAIKLIRAIADSLSNVDEENADVYRTNAESYIHGIQQVDEEINEIVQTSKRKKIVVADRFPFRYFVDAYGLNYAAAFGGCSDQNDASVATIAHLVDVVKEEGVPYLYYVELSTGNVANIVAEQTGAKTLLLHSCQNVSKAEFEEGATYLSLMRQNAQNLKKGLGES